METPEIYKMKLHEALNISKGLIAVRVPGGWLYFDQSDEGWNTTFVPFNNEYQSGIKL